MRVRSTIWVAVMVVAIGVATYRFGFDVAEIVAAVTAAVGAVWVARSERSRI